MRCCCCAGARASCRTLRRSLTSWLVTSASMRSARASSSAKLCRFASPSLSSCSRPKENTDATQRSSARAAHGSHDGSTADRRAAGASPARTFPRRRSLAAPAQRDAVERARDSAAARPSIQTYILSMRLIRTAELCTAARGPVLTSSLRSRATPHASTARRVSRNAFTAFHLQSRGAARHAGRFGAAHTPAPRRRPSAAAERCSPAQKARRACAHDGKRNGRGRA